VVLKDFLLMFVLGLSAHSAFADLPCPASQQQDCYILQAVSVTPGDAIYSAFCYNEPKLLSVLQPSYASLFTFYDMNQRAVRKEYLGWEDVQNDDPSNIYWGALNERIWITWTIHPEQTRIHINKSAYLQKSKLRICRKQTN